MICYDDEYWKAIPGYNSLYFASNKGRIKSVDMECQNTGRDSNGNPATRVHYGKFLSCKKLTKKGYMRANLLNKCFQWHRLIAMTWIPNPDNKPQVNHIDGNKTNNNVDNLEWCSNQHNRDHAVRTGLHASGERARNKLTTEQVIRIMEAIDTGVRVCDLSRQYNVSRSCIDNIKSRVTWKCISYDKNDK